MPDRTYSFSGLRYAAVSVESERLRYSAETLGLRRQVIESAAQRWRLEIEFEATRGASAAALLARRNLVGASVPLLVPMPQPLGVDPPTQALSLTGSAGAANARVSGAGISSGSEPVLPAGTFFRLAGVGKLYQIAFSATIPASGSATVFVHPHLLADASGAAMDLSPDLRCRIDPDSDFAARYRGGDVTRGIRLELIEVLP